MVAVWIGIAFLCGLVARQVGLPTLVGYLLAGVALSLYGVEGGEALENLAHIGVLLLLFSVGLKLKIKSLFRPEVIAGSLLHMLISTALIGAVMIWVFQLSEGMGALVAVSLAFSSTVVAAKVLEGKRELRAFHGRVAIGILVMQDLVAVVLLSSLGGEAPSVWAFGLFLLPLLRPLIFKLQDYSGHGELLVLFGMLLAVVLGGAGFEALGLSGELGALLMGAMIAEHPKSSELSVSLWSLKEMLLVGFFLQIGMAGIPNIEQMALALILTLLLPLKAALFFFLLMLFKLRARSAFLASLSLATYSEFGLIVANMAVDGGMMSNEWLVTIAMAVILSFIISAPLNRFSHALYERWESRLTRFEHDEVHPDDEPISLGHSTILVMGMGRVGTGAYDYFAGKGARVVGMDSDMMRVEKQREEKRRVLYADAEDPGLWANLRLDGITAVVLCMPDPEANHIAVRQLRKTKFTGMITASATYPEQVALFEGAGADFAYDYYSRAGFGYAEHVWKKMPIDESRYDEIEERYR